MYFTLNSKATEATLTRVVRTANKSFRLRLELNYGGQQFDNPCCLGKAMHEHLCVEHGLPRGAIKTFDGWNKLKVHIDDKIYRLEHLLPSSARKGDTAVEKLPKLGQDKRKHDLKKILADGAQTTSPIYVEAPARKRRRTAASEGRTVILVSGEGLSAAAAAAAAANQSPISLRWNNRLNCQRNTRSRATIIPADEALAPLHRVQPKHMTLLMEHMQLHQQLCKYEDIVTAVEKIAPETLKIVLAGAS